MIDGVKPKVLLKILALKKLTTKEHLYFVIFDMRSNSDSDCETPERKYLAFTGSTLMLSSVAKHNAASSNYILTH